MKPEYTPLDKLTPNTRAYKLRVKVKEKSRAKTPPGKKTYKRIILEDEKGNLLKGALFGDEIEGFKGVLELDKEYEIANAPLRLIDPKFETRPGECQISFGGQTIIQHVDANAGPLMPKYLSIADVPRTSTQQDRFDVLGIVLFMEETRTIKTGAGIDHQVRETVITEHSTYQPLIVSDRDELTSTDCQQLNTWAQSFLVVGFTSLRPTTHKGFSMVTSMSTIITTTPHGDKAYALRTWVRENQTLLADQRSKVLQIRNPPTTRLITTIAELELKKVCNSMQEERHWLKKTIPNHQHKVIAHLGCNNFGRRSDLPNDVTYTCSFCSKQSCISTPRVNFTFEATDNTGTLLLAAFAEQCEKLLKLTSSQILEKKINDDWKDFTELTKDLTSKTTFIQVGPATSLSRIRFLKWMIKSISFD